MARRPDLVDLRDGVAQPTAENLTLDTADALSARSLLWGQLAAQSSQMYSGQRMHPGRGTGRAVQGTVSRIATRAHRYSDLKSDVAGQRQRSADGEVSPQPGGGQPTTALGGLGLRKRLKLSLAGRSVSLQCARDGILGVPALLRVQQWTHGRQVPLQRLGQWRHGQMMHDPILPSSPCQTSRPPHPSLDGELRILAHGDQRLGRDEGHDLRGDQFVAGLIPPQRECTVKVVDGAGARREPRHE